MVIWKLDRLGRNLNHLVKTKGVLSARGVGPTKWQDTSMVELWVKSVMLYRYVDSQSNRRDYGNRVLAA